MFKKLKQRIEEEEQQPAKASSTPKKNTRNQVRNFNYTPTTTNLSRENKWEKRGRSNASLYSSRESLLSIDSSATATISRVSYGESSSVGTPVESPLILSSTFRDVSSKEEVLSELSKRNEQVKRLEAKINEMAVAFMEKSRERDTLEEALQNFRNEMHTRTENSINESLKAMKQEYETKILERDRQMKECLQKQQAEVQRFSDVSELNKLQQEEVAKMKAMTEMSRKTAELVEKTKQIENLDKQYIEQKQDLEGMQDRLDDIKRDRTKYETQEKQLTNKVSVLEKEKLALKSQLSDIVNELTQKSSLIENLQLSSDRAQEEAASLRQTYNLYKAKATSDINDKERQISVLKERITDLEQRLSDSKLSENDQVKALEKERSLLEKRLQDTREQLGDLRTQSNDKISTLGSLVTSLDEKVKEKAEAYEQQNKENEAQKREYESKILDLTEKLSASEKKAQSLQSSTQCSTTLQNKIKELEQKNNILKTEKLELEILADKALFLESQNKLLDTRFKETVERLEADRSSLEEKVRELQSESRKSSYRQEHTSKRRVEQLESKVEELNRRITQYQERLEELVEEKDTIYAELTVKEDECKEASKCLEDAMSKTNELKKEISQLEVSLKEKDSLLSYIKETGEPFHDNADTSMDSLLREELKETREMFRLREQELIVRDEEIEELRRVIRDRDDELVTVSKKLRDFEENNQLVTPRGRSRGSNEKELQKTVARLTHRIHELETQANDTIKSSSNTLIVENRSLKAELQELQQKVKNLLHQNNELKKQVIKEMYSQIYIVGWMQNVMPFKKLNNTIGLKLSRKKLLMIS